MPGEITYYFLRAVFGEERDWKLNYILAVKIYPGLANHKTRQKWFEI
jgi:hypothetical protein